MAGISCCPRGRTFVPVGTWRHAPVSRYFSHSCRLLQACVVKYDAVAEVVAIMRCNGIAGFLWCIHITTRLCEDVVMRMLRKIV